MSEAKRTDQPADLDWEAFRYVAAEMTDAEATEFEMRLANDQASREAVAAAVELTEVVSVCAAEDVTPAIYWKAVLAGVGLGIAASVAIVLFSLSERDSQDGGDQYHVTADGLDSHDSSELALLWSEMRDEVATAEETEAFWNLPASAGVGGAELIDEDFPGEDELATPEWMLAGIRSLEETDAEMPDDIDVDQGEES